jgi:DNA ligase-3
MHSLIHSSHTLLSYTPLTHSHALLSYPRQDLQYIVATYHNNPNAKAGGMVRGMSGGDPSSSRILTPMKPMLAEALKKFQKALDKNLAGLFAEIKYDGERVQIHKSGNDFKYYSRSLKPVTAHKVTSYLTSIL